MDAAPLSWADNCCDCWFTSCRSRIKKRVTKRRRVHLITDAATLLTKITAITMFVAGFLDIVEANAVRCGNGTYWRPTTQYAILTWAFIMFMLILLCKCCESETLPWSRILGVVWHLFGMSAYFLYWPGFNNKSCPLVTSPNFQPYRFIHPMVIFSNDTRLVEPTTTTTTVSPTREPGDPGDGCVHYTNHSSVQFLRKELQVVVGSTSLIWIICFLICYGYLSLKISLALGKFFEKTITRRPVSCPPPPSEDDTPPSQFGGEPEGSVMLPMVRVAQSVIPVVQSRIPVAQPRIPVAQPRIPVAQPAQSSSAYRSRIREPYAQPQRPSDVYLSRVRGPVSQSEQPLDQPDDQELIIFMTPPPPKAAISPEKAQFFNYKVTQSPTDPTGSQATSSVDRSMCVECGGFIEPNQSASSSSDATSSQATRGRGFRQPLAISNCPRFCQKCTSKFRKPK